jgi:hypothetical protein
VGSPAECNGKQQNGTMGGGLRQQWLQDEARCHAAKALLVSLCTRRPEDPCRFPSKAFAWSRGIGELNPFHPWARRELCQTSNRGRLPTTSGVLALNLGRAGTIRELQCFCLFACGRLKHVGSHQGRYEQGLSVR